MVDDGLMDRNWVGDGEELVLAMDELDAMMVSASCCDDGRKLERTDTFEIKRQRLRSDLEK